MKTKLIKIAGANAVGGDTVPARCPHCGRQGSFEPIQNVSDVNGSIFEDGQNKVYRLGVRRCPNPNCLGQLFVQRFSNEIVTYPTELIDFDSTDIPPSIVEAFEEALICEANGAPIAAAMMVRKTLEMICADRGAKGSDLHQRLKALESEISLPKQMFIAMQNLRLLGNDAAHVESNVFEEVGSEEVRVAIDLAKEILKGVYQLDAIVGRLEKFKKASE